jgi:hypothetical protein
LLNFLKHRGEEHDSHNSSGFTLAELGAGLGVFALAASLMAPMAVSSATASLTADGETNVTVNNDNDGRKTSTQIKADAVKVVVKDATGTVVYDKVIEDTDTLNAKQYVVDSTNLDSDQAYTFEVSQVGTKTKGGGAVESAKAVAVLERQKVGEENYEVPVQETYLEEKSADVAAVPEQVDDTSRPIYKNVDDKSKPIYKQVQENYTVMVTKIRQVRQSYTARVPYRVRVTKYRNVRVRTPQYRNTNHRHYYYTYQRRYRSWTHYHRGCWNHTHRWRWYRWNHRHCRSWAHRHGGWTTQRVRRSYNHTHRTLWTYTYSYRRQAYTDYETRYRNEIRYRTVNQHYTVPETRTRTKTVFDRYAKKRVFDRYAKKTQYRLCYRPRGFNGVRLAQRCEIKNSPTTKKLTWKVEKQREVMEQRTRDVMGFVNTVKKVQAPTNYVIFKADALEEGKVYSSGTIVAAGSGTNLSEGDTADFLRWSGKKFTFDGQQYIRVHKKALG